MAGEAEGNMPSGNEPVKYYMEEIGEIPLVTPEDEAELAARIRNGSQEAREQLIKSNLRLVVKIAHDFKSLGLPLLDLISEGNIGLMRAVEKFDPDKGAKFSSYASWWIKQSMRRALANQSRTIRIPLQSAGKLNKIKTVRSELMEELGRDPTDREIAQRLEFSERTVSGLRKADVQGVSLQSAIQEGEEGSLEELVPDEEGRTPEQMVNHHDALRRLEELLDYLHDKERIIQMRFGLNSTSPKTLDEVSQYIGRTRERVRQIQKQALTKLKQYYEEPFELQTKYPRGG